MKLSEKEIRDIAALLEAGKPLPDKYRFVLFGDDRELELVWNGKTNEITNVVLPFQVIEHVDEPRPEEIRNQQIDMFDASSGRQLKGWTNKLIWGDNKFILSSLKGGPLREEIEEQGGIKLIYIDPPFDVGADFTMDIEVGENTFEKHPNVLEELAYRDTWGKGSDSYISMMYERLALMRDLLADDGSIYVHCDWRVCGFLRLVLDEVFGGSSFNAELIWKKTTKTTSFINYGSEHDTIFYYTKSSDNYLFNQAFKPLKESELTSKYIYLEKPNGEIIKLTKDQIDGKEQTQKGRRFRGVPLLNMNQNRPNLRFEFLGHTRVWATKKEKLEGMLKENKIFQFADGLPQKKGYLDENLGAKVNDVWDDINPVNSQALEKQNYPTQKPEALLSRIISVSSNEGDIVTDFFIGSGTTAVVAEKLGRKWIGSDLGKFAIHTTRKRLISVQRELNNEGKDYRAFEVLNLGRYEREYFVTGYKELDESTKSQLTINKEHEFNKLILQAYQAEPSDGFKTLKGRKNNRFVSIGPVNLPLSRYFAEEVIKECLDKGITKIDLLSFEFEMGLFPNIQDYAAQKGVDLVLKTIPIEVFDKRAVEKGEAKFYDVAYIEVKIHQKKNSIAVELKNYSVFYTQGSSTATEQNLKDGKSAIIVDNGEVLKVAKDKEGNILTREQLTKNWSDWIDYWSVDFDFESKKEIIRKKDIDTGEVELKWTGSYVFENVWQSFRTKKDRSLELVSAYWECPMGRRKVAIKVIDIFGNDTMKIVDVDVGKAF